MVTQLFEDPRSYFTTVYTAVEGDDFTGTSVLFWANGGIRTIMQLRDGEKHGCEISFHPSRSVSSAQVYRDGVRFGEQLLLTTSGLVRRNHLVFGSKVIPLNDQTRLKYAEYLLTKDDLSLVNRLIPLCRPISRLIRASV